MQDDLRRARANLRVLDEQVHHLREIADESETRKLVAETPLADREWRDAVRDLDAHHASLVEARAEVEELEVLRDRLLDRMLEVEGTT